MEAARGTIEDGGLLDALAMEMFQRDKTSAIMSVVGVVVLVALHWPVVPVTILLLWSAFMVVVLSVRVVFATVSQKSRHDRAVAVKNVNIYSVLCALAGLGWGSTLFLFDGGHADHLYYLRVLILTAALAAGTATLSVFARTYVGFTFALFLPGVYQILHTDYGAEARLLFFCALVYLGALLAIAYMNGRRFRAGVAEHLARIAAIAELRKKNEELSEALSRIHELEGILPICASCKKIRDENGTWHHVETYIEEHSKAEFTHGCCPECMKELYPDYMRKKAAG